MRPRCEAAELVRTDTQRRDPVEVVLYRDPGGTGYAHIGDSDLLTHHMDVVIQDVAQWLTGRTPACFEPLLGQRFELWAVPTISARP